MREVGLILPPDAVRAILAGNKNSLRIPLREQPDTLPELCCNVIDSRGNPSWVSALRIKGASMGARYQSCPYGTVGDRVWVRETWQLNATFTDVCHVVYRASERQSWTEMHRRFPVELSRGTKAKPFQMGWRASAQMPRWACRLVLEVVNLRVERLHDISDEQAMTEGVVEIRTPANTKAYSYERTGPVAATPREAFAQHWQQAHGNWAENPYVWVIGFKADILTTP